METIQMFLTTAYCMEVSSATIIGKREEESPVVGWGNGGGLLPE